MRFFQAIKTAFNTQQKQGAAGLTLTITLIILTPVCGALFQCGCTWPGFGLDTRCNFYQPSADHVCPWCVSLVTGLLSASVSVIPALWAATATSTSRLLSTHHRPVSGIIIRTSLGIIAFMLLSVLCAGLAAYYQQYPYGLGELFFP